MIKESKANEEGIHLIERRYKLLNGNTLLVSKECLGVISESGMKSMVEFDEVFDHVLALVDMGNEAARELERAKKQAILWNEESVRLKKELKEAQQRITKETKQSEMWHDLYLRAINEQDQNQTVEVLSSFAKPIIQAALAGESICRENVLETAVQHGLIDQDPDRLEDCYLFTETLNIQENKVTLK